MKAEYLQRFGGIARLYGQSALGSFSQAKVCVVGIGGVGSWAAEALARAGINQITLIDMDDICITNTNRQIHAMQGTVGRLKTEVMAERIRAINPDCEVIEVDDFVTADNLAEHIKREFDYVVDAIDSVKEDYDYVLIDCPPSLGLLTINAFAAATEVLVPIQCEYYALEGLSQLLRNIDLIQKNLNPQLALSTILLTMYDSRTKLAAQVVSDVREHFPRQTLNAVIGDT